MARYRKKPIEVEAFLFGVDNMPDWFMDKVTSKDVVLHHIPFDEARARNYGQMWCDIKTLEGTMQAYEGKDYIIKGISGEIYPCKTDIFEATYEMPTADVVPKSEAYDDHQKQVACYTLGCQEGDKIRREVAREIFDEIEKHAMVGQTPFGLILYQIGVGTLAELKKKYTEGEE